MLGIWDTAFSGETHLFPNSRIKWILIEYTDRGNSTLGLVVSGHMFLHAFTPIVARITDISFFHWIQLKALIDGLYQARLQDMMTLKVRSQFSVGKVQTEQ